MYADFRHRMPLRVRWAEVDKQGVVFNAHYLLYCDVCVTEYWRAVGLRYPEDFVAHNGDLFVRKPRSITFRGRTTMTNWRSAAALRGWAEAACASWSRYFGAGSMKPCW